MHAREVAAQHRLSVEPEAGEDPAPVDAVRVGGLPLVLAVAEGEPVDVPLAHAPHHVLLNTIAAIGAHLVVEIVAGAAGGDLRYELRRPLDVVVLGDCRLAAARGIEE